nr:glycosyltransferase [Cellulomonas shaoxiangyii]
MAATPVPWPQGLLVGEPAVSVILPVYQAGVALEQSFARISRTRLPDAEILVVDDGSTDGTAHRVRSFAARDARVRPVLLEQNGGVAAARNTALALARGEYVWFLDWDDEWDESIAEKLVERAREARADVVVCRATWRQPDGLDTAVLDGLPAARTLTGPEAFDLVLAGRFRGYLWSKLFRRDLLGADPFPPMQSQSDFCGLVPVLAAAATVATVPDVLYHHVIREGSITNSRHPVLDNLNRCRETVRRVAETLPPSEGRERLLLHYDYHAWHLARVNTALRLSSADVARAEIKDVVGRMRLGEIAALVPVSLDVATRSLLVRVAGQQYAAVRRLYVGVRARLRKVRGRLKVAR